MFDFDSAATLHVRISNCDSIGCLIFARKKKKKKKNRGLIDWCMMSAQSLRKALGALKDSTTVSLARVHSEFKELDIAVVKATSHVECPPKEKYVRAIFLATSASRPRADVAYCIHLLARRLAKTHNWTVAVKTLIVIHRTLREGDPTFREELVNYSHRGGYVLNLSNFKDNSGSKAWDYSAWVRTYALFLEEHLECFHLLKYDVDLERSMGHSETRDLDTADLLQHLPALQQLLHRLTGCQPEGAAISNYVIQYALSLVFKESFKLYRAINDGIINLVDKFFEMQRHDALKALEIYKQTSQQTERLSDFYEACKGLELARGFQFPTLEQPPQSFLLTMEEYVRDAPRIVTIPKDVLDYNHNHVLALPSAPYSEPEDVVVKQDVPFMANLPVHNPTLAPNHENDDLLGLHETKSNALDIEESNALALAILPAGTTSNETTKAPQATGGSSLEAGATGWELALVTNPSSNNLAVNNSKLAGGFDKFVLDSLYDEALSKRTLYGGPPNSYNLVRSPFQAAAPVQPDPFLASGKYAPPHNVQMAAMAQHQHAMMMQQQMNGLQFSNNPFGASYVPLYPNPPPPPPPYHQNNPFGNPGLL